MKTLIFQVSEYGVGTLGLKKRDIGRWVLLVAGCVHFRESREDCLKMRAYVEGV